MIFFKAQYSYIYYFILLFDLERLEGYDIMVEDLIRKTSKRTWYKWSIYVNLILFFIIGLFFYLLIKDCLHVGGLRYVGDEWLLIARDVTFISIALALIFVQLIRNIATIMRRSL